MHSINKLDEPANQAVEKPRTEDNDRSRKELLGQLADSISIAGLKETVMEDNRPTRYLFGIGLLLATVFGVYEAVQIIRDHLERTTSINIRFGSDHNYFPDITICSIGMPNTVRARELLTIPEEVKKQLRRLSIDDDTFLDDVAQLATTSFSMKAAVNETLLLLKLKTMDTVLQGLPNGFAGWLSAVLPNCTQTLSKCTFNGVPFDCCTSAKFVAMEGEICYQLDLNKYDRKVFSRSMNNDKTAVQHYRSFIVDAQFDWRNVTAAVDDQTDGFLVTVAEPQSIIAKMPLAVASGWNAFIRLTRITRTHDISSCVAGDGKTKYLRNYDNYGINCMLDTAIDFVNNMFGCKILNGAFAPEMNESCSYSQYNAVRALVSAEGILDDKNVLKMFKQWALTYARGEMCRPKCTRWLYFPMVSYAKRGLEEDTGRVSRSRITITISDSEFEEHFEQPKNSVYLAMCDVGGVMGTCIGISIISFAQLIAYAAQICLARERRKACVNA